jgi:hypothetical protein
VGTIRRHRVPLALGSVFVVVGVIYAVAQVALGAPRPDLTGVVALVALGAAMAFTFGVLLSGNEPGE